MKKMEKEKFKKKNQKNSVFWVVVKKNGLFFVKLSFFRKIGKHYLHSEGKKNAHFRCNYLFLEMVLFICGHSKWQNTIKIGVSAGTGVKPKMALLVAKVPFWEGAPKGVLLSVIPKSCALLKTLFL